MLGETYQSPAASESRGGLRPATMSPHMRIEGWRTNLPAPVPHVRRIVAIAPSTTEILHALGLGRRIVGVDRWSDYPPRVLRLPQIGSDLHVDVERVATCSPTSWWLRCTCPAWRTTCRPSNA